MDRNGDSIAAEAERFVAVAFAADGRSVVVVAAVVVGDKCSVGHIQDSWVIVGRSNGVAVFADRSAAAEEEFEDAEDAGDDSMGFVVDGLADNVAVAYAELDYRLCRWFQ